MHHLGILALRAGLLGCVAGASPALAGGPATSPEASPSSQAQLRQRLVDALQVRARASADMRWEFTEEGFFASSPGQVTLRRSFRVIRGGSRVRFDLKFDAPSDQPGAHYTSHEGFCDGVHAGYNVLDKATDGSASGSITSAGQCPWSGHGWTQVIEYGLYGTPRSVLQFASSPDHDVAYESSRDGTVITLRATLRNAQSTHVVEKLDCSFDSRQGWLLTDSHYECGVLGEEPFSINGTYHVAETQLTPRGLVVPRVAELRGVPGKNDPFVDKGPGGTRWVVSRAEEIPAAGDSDFKVRMPVGASCFDGVHNVSFIAGKAAVVSGSDGMHYHASPEVFPFLRDWTDLCHGMTDEQWEGSETKRMVDQTWAEVVDGKVVPRSAGAATVAPGTPGHPDVERPAYNAVFSIASAACMAAAVGVFVYSWRRGSSKG